MRFSKMTLAENKDVLAIPPRRLGRHRHEFGLFDAGGQAVPDDDVVSITFNTVRPAAPPPAEAVAEVTGPTLFAGFAPSHFGHAVTAGLGRLWALDRMTRRTRLLFVTRGNARHIPAMARLLEMLAIPNRMLFLRQPTRFNRLYTAPDLFGERFGGRASPDYVEWIRGRLASDEAVVPGSKLYVSRSSLGPMVGRIVCEDLLQDQLAQNGYDVIFPERHSLAEQLSAYRKAETLIFAEGSAAHVFAFVKRPEQRAVVLQRRSEMGPLIADNLAAFDPTPAVIVNAIIREWRPNRRADNTSISELDFDRLREKLVACGALTPLGPWRAPTAEEVAASLNLSIEAGDELRRIA